MSSSCYTIIVYFIMINLKYLWKSARSLPNFANTAILCFPNISNLRNFNASRVCGIPIIGWNLVKHHTVPEKYNQFEFE